MRVQEEVPTRRRAKNKNAIRQNILLTILTPKPGYIAFIRQSTQGFASLKVTAKTSIPDFSEPLLPGLSRGPKKSAGIYKGGFEVRGLLDKI
jgi:hypothetical protein